MRNAPWYPWLSAALWGLLVFGLLLVNTGGNALLSAAGGAVVAELSRRIAKARGSAEQ